MNERTNLTPLEGSEKTLVASSGDKEGATETASDNQDLVLQIGKVIEETIQPLGYELVWLEIVNHRTGALRVFIDHFSQTDSQSDLQADPLNYKVELDKKAGITVEDCARVSHALDLPLEEMIDRMGLFSGAYELEVSSPGVNRPLWRLKDYVRFLGQEARLHLLRPLMASESGNETYVQKNPKQKNYFGILDSVHFSQDLIQLKLIPEGSSRGVQNSKKKKQQPGNEKLLTVTIPIGLVQKAHLEPPFLLTATAEKSALPADRKGKQPFTRKDS